MHFESPIILVSFLYLNISVNILKSNYHVVFQAFSLMVHNNYGDSISNIKYCLCLKQWLPHDFAYINFEMGLVIPEVLLKL